VSVSWSRLRDLGVQIRPWDGPVPPCADQWSRFKASFGTTVALLSRELHMLGATAIALEIGLREGDIRNDGFPRADRRMQHSAVRLSFTSPWGPLQYETNEYRDWEDNLRAIALSLEALRAVDRYGVSKRGEQYRGWKQLPMTVADPADSIATSAHAREWLNGFRRGTESDAEALRTAIRKTHPDAGGDDVSFRKTMRAKEVLAL